MSGRECSWKLRFLVGALVLAFLGGKPLYAQGTKVYTATLRGTVTDPAGLIIKGAKVTLTASELGISRENTTDVDGLYSFTFLPEGTYTLDVEFTGFKHYRQEGITLVAGQVAEQPVKLTIGSVAESVEVTEQAPLLNTDNANISLDLSSKTLLDLPLSFRSVLYLTTLNSSVSNTAEYQVVGGNGLSGTADQDTSFLHFGGTYFDTAIYLLDGSFDTRADWGGIIYLPSIDTVQEFKIQTNSFSAEYGFSMGNVVNIVTKSGTNQFHGDAYEFYGNSGTYAKNFFNTGPEPSFTRNQFGVTFGGPIQKGKTFFFVSYEGLRQSFPATNLYTVPTAAERAGNFSVLLGGQIGTDYEGRPVYTGELYNPFSTRQVTCGAADPVTGNLVSNCPAGKATEEIRDPISGNIATGLGVTNIIPAALMDTINSGVAAANYWPAPTNSSLVNNYLGSGGAPEHSNEYSIRLDHIFDDNNRVWARWSQKFQTKTNTPTFYGPNNPAGPGLINPNNRYAVAGGYSHVFSPTFAMNVTLGVTRHVEGGVTQGYLFKSSTLGLPTFINTNAPSYPEYTESGYANLGASGGNDNYITPQTLWTQAVDFTKSLGKHQFSFGFVNIWLRIDGGHYGDTTLNFSSGSTAGPDPLNNLVPGNGMATFLLGVGTGSATQLNQFPATDKNWLGWYFQDTWKITPKFTLNLGGRYEIQTAPTERRNEQDYFNPTAPNPICGAGGAAVPCYGEIVYNTGSQRGLYNTRYNNLSPRIGASYQVTNKLVLQGGYGIFYSANFYGQGPNDGYSVSTPWNTSLNGGLNPASTLSGNPNANCNVAGPPAFTPCGPAFTVPRPVTGNADAGLTNVGFGTGAVYPVRSSPVLQQWTAGAQYAFTNNDLLYIAYVGNSGSNIVYSSLNWDTLPAFYMAEAAAGTFNPNAQVPNPFFGHITSSGCGLNNATITAGQLVLPFPEFCGVGGTEPAEGSSNYKALQVTYKRRWSQGLSLNISYTYSKFWDDTNGQSGWAFPGHGQNILNAYNLAAEWSPDVSNTPNAFVGAYSYELPLGRGKAFGSDMSGVANAILGGWQVSGIITARSGFPISLNTDNNNCGCYGGGQRPNLVPGVSLVPQHQSYMDWVNVAALSQPAAYTFGDAPRFLANFHAPRFTNWDMSVIKSWKISESKVAQFRWDMFNMLNHPNFYEPDTNLGDAAFGTISQAYPSRTMQFAGKFYF
jgi:hypothetical protein